MSGIRPAASPWLEVVIPARNEQARLSAGLARLCDALAVLPLGVAVIVVDSASTDGTSGIVRRWPAGDVPVRLLPCARSGKGAAVRAGLLATTAPYVGFCDADMATDPAAIEAAVWLLASGHQAVIGSRSHPASQVDDRHSIVRKAGAAVFRSAARLIVPGVGDTQCGFKFFAGPVARTAAAALRAPGYSFDIELVARCRQLGAEPVELPVRWYDVPGSTFSVWRHSVAAFAEMAVIWWSMRARPTQQPAIRRPTRKLTALDRFGDAVYRSSELTSPQPSGGGWRRS